ncbi:MAG TPA: DnaA regulatory inactivator Hda [Rhodanobacteraceae bacterium]|nr:DnaA regulatory inactivator Hda [Rhodanobacteraceae bacterium]
MTRQFPLDLRWPPHQRLDAFWPGANAGALGDVAKLAESTRQPWLFLHGAAGTGKSHLLIGACRAALDAGRAARYVSLAALPAPRAKALGELAPGDLLALDDVQAVAGDAASEQALFGLYNRAQSAASSLLFAAPAPPGELGIGLPDLVSRLARCTQWAMRPLDDAGRRAMLWLLTRRLGLRLDDDVLDWLMARHPRDTASLVALVRRIDRAALAAQRRVTVPFLRGLLRESDT